MASNIVQVMESKEAKLRQRKKLLRPIIALSYWGFSRASVQFTLWILANAVYMAVYAARFSQPQYTTAFLFAKLFGGPLNLNVMLILLSMMRVTICFLRDLPPLFGIAALDLEPWLLFHESAHTFWLPWAIGLGSLGHTIAHLVNLGNFADPSVALTAGLSTLPPNTAQYRLTTLQSTPYLSGFLLLAIFTLIGLVSLLRHGDGHLVLCTRRRLFDVVHRWGFVAFLVVLCFHGPVFSFFIMLPAALLLLESAWRSFRSSVFPYHIDHHIKGSGSRRRLTLKFYPSCKPWLAAIKGRLSSESSESRRAAPAINVSGVSGVGGGDDDDERTQFLNDSLVDSNRALGGALGSAASERRLCDWGFRPGQWCFVCVPDINPWEWHPFSMKSKPQQSSFALEIAERAHWTRRLFELIEERRAVPYMRIDYAFHSKVEYPIGIRWPLWNPLGGTYQWYKKPRSADVLVLLAQGIACTPIWSLWRQLDHMDPERTRTPRFFAESGLDFKDEEGINEDGISFHTRSYVVHTGDAQMGRQTDRLIASYEKELRPSRVRNRRIEIIYSGSDLEGFQELCDKIKHAGYSSWRLQAESFDGQTQASLAAIPVFAYP